MAAITEELDWMEDVREKLVNVFEGREEDLCRILHFLDEQDSGYKDNPSRPFCPQWRSLKSTLNSDRAFEIFAKKLAEDTKKAEKDAAFRYRLNMVYEEMLDYSEDSQSAENFQGFDVVRLHDRELNNTSAFGGLARAWSILPLESKTAIRDLIPKVLGNRQIVSAADEFVGLVDKTGGTIVMVGLAAAHLCYKAYEHIRRWWRGEISGKRCAKGLIDDTIAVVAGVGGGVAGAFLGSLAGPWGTVIGGIVGGWVSGAGANYITDRLTQKIFGIPQSEALENAYKYLGVEMSASNSDINAAFRKKCLQYHPDRPTGDNDEFIVLQSYMAVIRQSRGVY